MRIKTFIFCTLNHSEKEKKRKEKTVELYDSTSTHQKRKLWCATLVNVVKTYHYQCINHKRMSSAAVFFF